MSFSSDHEGKCDITAVAMEGNCTETVQKTSDGQTSDATMRYGLDPAGTNNKERTCDMPDAVADSICERNVSAFPESVDVNKQNVESGADRMLHMRSDIEGDSETSNGAEKPPDPSEIGHCEQKTDSTAELQDSRPASYDVNNAAEADQSQANVQDLWRPSNSLLEVASSNNSNAGDSAMPKTVFSSSFVQTHSPVDISERVTKSLPLSTSAPCDIVTGYAKLRESGPSSLCSALPYESPTHVASGGGEVDLTTDAAGNRPDSLYLSRSILQERERQWLAKKGSYSSLSECDSSPGGSVDALIEVATSTPLHSQGTVSMDGDMITFVADGINELIKRSRGG